MRYVFACFVIVSLVFAPLASSAETEPVVVHENVIIENDVELYEGFRSPNEMVFIFILIVLLSVIGLGIINAIE
ncbi:MAG: hypothetical protein LPJ96_01725 [Exiguobacterium sp.]|uniref:Uncharacterized protein n=1 Tax=Exiguobacterium alkaliphilum TaxID=1428684 RepID=A0ABT2KXG7_9BACL|nr:MULTISPECIES: hypothetical protein [Exiguobacterium]MDX5322310.1 hypothetical protein [Exiguobacterium sp.]KDN58404.1 hypothetical protein DI14_12375 [Exiguobacterium sp. AB2]MCT4794235.1 hypothetical protein [Exiguobacterium alkaliphilum]MDX5424032.1 hypothetical protein [Exiguobacterium sp.]MDX6771557.1 hypothetical protein [Exiguobacterium sp.]